jgi:hypothetical protein
LGRHDEEALALAGAVIPVCEIGVGESFICFKLIILIFLLLQK